MNVYTIAPLIASLAYIPLIVTIASSRPWQKRYTHFILFMFAAILWGIFDIFLRSDYLPQYKYLFLQLIILIYMLMVVQFHHFTSSFFGDGHGHWLFFAYGSLVLTIIYTLVAIIYIPASVESAESITFFNYGKWFFFVLASLLILVARNYYIFSKMLRKLKNPVLYNQIVILMLTIAVLTVFTIASLLPYAKQFPVSHYGNLINAFILSYAVIRHRLVDIRIVIRRGTAWFSLAVIGIAAYWLLLIIADSIFNLKLDLFASIIATVLAFIVSIIVYVLRGQLFKLMSRAFRGSSYNYHQKLNEFTNKIHNVFSLKEQGGELLSLLVKALNIKQVCLLFPEAGSGDYLTQFYEPINEQNQLNNLRLRANNPIVKYLEKEQKFLSSDNLPVLPTFLSLWPQEREEIDSKHISMFVPLISRDRLIAILVVGEKLSGRYSLEDITIIENATSRVAVSMEKEYLREQLRESEEELSVINNSSVILSSSLDIQEIFGSFIEELKKVIDVNWAAIVLTGEDEFYTMALSAPEISAYQIGDRIPMEGTGTGWVVTQKKSFIETDLARERYFNTSEFFYTQGLRTVAYLPLIAKGRVIGSFIVASKTPNAYSQRQVRLLEQLASQIAMPLENSQLYAKAEKKARVDELTGLFNRRSLDEMIDSEISRHGRYGGAFSLAILDLDSFKSFNDTYGHLAGDSLLKEIGFIIKSAIRSADFAFRYGGDEFAILLPQTTIDAALQVVERVRKKIAEGVKSDKIPITASIGLASWPDDGISHTDIIASADVTLYRAKRNGGNQSLYAASPLSLLKQDSSPTGNGRSLDSKFSGIIHAFSEMIDAMSYYSHNHSKRVMDYALALAKALKLNRDEMKTIETCALLHDAGKISISGTILNKLGDLTQEEWQVIKTHPQVGADLIKHIPQLAPCIGGILHHHEWYDGSGYPDGLKGEDIPLEARILAIADAFATMISERSYSETRTHESALEEIKRCSGTQFDPYMVEQFVAIFEGRTVSTKKKARR